MINVARISKIWIVTLSILIFLSSSVIPVFALELNCVDNAPNLTSDFVNKREYQLGEEIIAEFSPPLIVPSSEADAYIVFYLDGKVIPNKKFILNSPPASWTVNIGTPDDGWHTFGWSLEYKKESRNVFNGHEHCGGLQFQVCDGPCQLASGQNPCTIGATGQCPTAIGNIPTTPQGLAQRILSIALGLAGGLALILMVIGAIRVLMSEGDQQRLTGGRDMITAAVAGLLFLILSVITLRFIGLTVLNIPGFG